MKSVTYLGETYEAEIIIETNDSIIGYIEDSEVFAFRGVSDFSLFVFDGESDNAQPSEIDIILLAIDDLYKKISGGVA